MKQSPTQKEQLRDYKLRTFHCDGTMYYHDSLRQSNPIREGKQKKKKYKINKGKEQFMISIGMRFIYLYI